MNLVRKIVEAKKYSFMLKQLVNRDFKIRYRGSIFGVLWSVLNPLLYMMVLSLVFSQIFNQVDNYKMYLLSGLVLFNFFSEATNMSVTAVLSNFGLITKVSFPKCILPMSKVCSSAINLLISVAVYLVLGFFMGLKFWWGYILIPYILICLFIFTIGMSFILSAAQVFMRDIMHLYNVLVQVWMYATPILYSIELAPKEIVPFIRVNPLYIFIDFMREITLNGNMPSASSFLFAFAWAIGMLILGSVVFIKSQDKFIYYT